MPMGLLPLSAHMAGHAAPFSSDLHGRLRRSSTDLFNLIPHISRGVYAEGLDALSAHMAGPSALPSNSLTTTVSAHRAVQLGPLRYLNKFDCIQPPSGSFLK